ncbi:MAG: HlyD family type I secretion periplasmic adaptor subunit [Devosia sp.]
MNGPGAMLRPSPVRPTDDHPPRALVYVIVVICTFMACAIAWASWAQVDEVSRAAGRVIPSGKTQIIQSAEPGVVIDILVRAGEQVRAGQQLMRLDDTTTSSNAGEVEAQVMALQAQVARLEIEAAGILLSEYACPTEVQTRAPAVCANQSDLLDARIAGLTQSKNVLGQRVEQRQRELNEVTSNIGSLGRSLDISRERLGLIEPLAERGLVARTELLATQSEANDLAGRVAAAEQSSKGLQAALQEAILQQGQADLQFRQDALAELTTRGAELASGLEQLRGASDRVARTDIRSPVDGIVNSVDITTIGAVVQAGTKLLDIVPVSDRLLVEARLKPSDVAFVVPGQAARVKLTAYDFSVYGGIDAVVENVSADSIVDPQTQETYYLVLIQADNITIAHNGKSLPILPGMVTSVDILTGKKTVLQYLLKPINKARQEALSER